MAFHPEKKAVIDAAWRWRDRCLIADGSILSDEPLWTAANLEQLVTHFIEKPDLSDRDFFTKLKDQLDPASPAAHRLAAEMLWVLNLFPIRIRADTKRQQIRRVWSWGGTSLAENQPEMGEPLEVGVGRVGLAYLTNRWRELQFLILMARELKARHEIERRQLFSDPWRFAEWIESRDWAAGRQIRHVLLYLLFPDTFEPIAAPEPKRAILRTFGPDAGIGDVDLKDRVAVDRALARIRSALESTRGAAFSFYEPEIKRVWNPDAPDEDEPPARTDPGSVEPAGRRRKVYGTADDAEWLRQRFGDRSVWLIATGDRGVLWPTFKEEGIIAIGWDDIGDLGRFDSRDAITRELTDLSGSDRQRVIDSLALWEFARAMRPDDIVVAKQGIHELLAYGTVTSDYQYRPERTTYRHVRTVRWERIGPWTLPERQRFTLKTLTYFSRYPDRLRSSFELMDGATVGGARPPRPPGPYGRTEALSDLFMAPETFDRIIDSLERRMNVILEGPPGVGKSFVARRMAWALMGERDDSRVLMVQFHQSYAYEDFIQGWRPAANGGFELRDGVFYEFCRRAASDPDRRYVFIIDEINRGNLSRILGEVMLLIEADKRGPEWAVPLTYARGLDHRFHVPANVYVLGLMNTADRSLALVDYALRRRFAFIRLEPGFETDAFREYFEDLADPAVVDLIVERMTALNERIREDRRNLGPGFEIGHSFFVPDGDVDVGLDWYERVIRTEIEPLLREYWFDDQTKVDSAVSELLRP